MAKRHGEERQEAGEMIEARKAMGRGKVVRGVLWGGAAALLIAQWVAMQVTDEVNWTAGDFLFAGILLGTTGLGMEAAVRMRTSPAWRGGAALALLAAVLIVLVNGAVGMIGTEDNVHNLLFLGVVALAVAGAAIVRLRAGGMAWVLAAAGVSHLGIALAGLPADPRGAMLSAGMSGLWFLAALLFRKAAHGQV
jgi:hypothetical protein